MAIVRSSDGYGTGAGDGCGTGAGDDYDIRDEST